jgi:hypothetical protein
MTIAAALEAQEKVGARPGLISAHASVVLGGMVGQNFANVLIGDDVKQ